MANIGGVTPKSIVKSGKAINTGGVTPKSTSQSGNVPTIGGVSVNKQ